MTASIATKARIVQYVYGGIDYDKRRLHETAKGKTGRVTCRKGQCAYVYPLQPTDTALQWKCLY